MAVGISSSATAGSPFLWRKPPVRPVVLRAAANFRRGKGAAAQVICLKNDKAGSVHPKHAEMVPQLVAGVMSGFGVSSVAVLAVSYRFCCPQMEDGEVPLSVASAVTSIALFLPLVGMEFWARWAHKALWHASLWHIHESHHKAREGAFELNDVFAVINAVPALALLSYGLFRKGLFPGLCFCVGLGITMFGMAYMFVHDGLVHKRFPVGPIANVPYFRKVVAAHQLHHSNKFDGVPYGLFLGPKELEEVVGGIEELQKKINNTNKSYHSS